MISISNEIRLLTFDVDLGEGRENEFFELLLIADSSGNNSDWDNLSNN